MQYRIQCSVASRRSLDRASGALLAMGRWPGQPKSRGSSALSGVCLSSVRPSQRHPQTPIVFQNRKGPRPAWERVTTEPCGQPIPAQPLCHSGAPWRRSNLRCRHLQERGSRWRRVLLQSLSGITGRHWTNYILTSTRSGRQVALRLTSSLDLRTCMSWKEVKTKQLQDHNPTQSLCAIHRE